jgi:hypothetical protein
MKSPRWFLEKTRRWDTRKEFRFSQVRMAFNRMRPNWARSTFPLFFVALFLVAIPSSAAQTATITYTQDFPGSDPAHYSIAVNKEGHAKYESSGKLSNDSDELQTYQYEFELSAKNRGHIFELARQAKYFAGNVDSGNDKLAFTGAKKLTYQDGARIQSASYNYSRLPAVGQLTAFFQNLSATLEYGRRLSYYHRYQKLALDEELKRMEAQAKDGSLSELQAVQPVLEEIVADSSVMNVVRARAQRLIAMGKV